MLEGLFTLMKQSTIATLDLTFLMNQLCESFTVLEASQIHLQSALEDLFRGALSPHFIPPELMLKTVVNLTLQDYALLFVPEAFLALFYQLSSTSYLFLNPDSLIVYWSLPLDDLTLILWHTNSFPLASWSLFLSAQEYS